MKRIPLLLLFSIIALFSCKEEECLDINDTIIGTWESPAFGEGTFEFQEDGNLVDDDLVLLSDMVGTLTADAKTWELDGNTLTLYVRSGSLYSSAIVEITYFECDLITIQQGEITANFNRVD